MAAYLLRCNGNSEFEIDNREMSDVPHHSLPFLSFKVCAFEGTSVTCNRLLFFICICIGTFCIQKRSHRFIMSAKGKSVKRLHQKPKWSELSINVYASVELTTDDEGGVNFTEEALGKICHPLLEVFEDSPYFFGKYRYLICPLESTELIGVVVFKTLLDKPQYFKNRAMMTPAMTRHRILRECGEDLFVHHAKVVVDLKVYFGKTSELCGHIRRFMSRFFIPSSYFDSESLLVALQLIVDEKINVLAARVGV